MPKKFIIMIACMTGLLCIGLLCIFLLGIFRKKADIDEIEDFKKESEMDNLEESLVQKPGEGKGELEVIPFDDSKTEDGLTSMVALAENEEEAKHIAELYGIEFVDFNYGVATYQTTQNPQELIEIGEKNNYPAISVNNKSYAY